MKIRGINIFLLITGIVIISCDRPIEDKLLIQEDGLSGLFQKPPIDARPRGLWTWVNGNYDSAEIWREIQEVHRMGMGGLDIWDAPAVRDPKNVVPVGPAVVSDDFMKGVKVAMHAARETGLELGFIWNQSVSFIDPEHSHMALLNTKKDVIGPGNKKIVLSFPTIKPNKKFRYKILQQDDNGRPKYWGDVVVLAFPFQDVDTSRIVKGEMVDLTANLVGDELTWTIPEGKWRILRFIWSRTTETGLTPTPATLKPALDFLNPDATEIHLTFLLDQMEKNVGPLRNSPLKYFCADSYEFKGLWTPDLPDAFKERLGYDLTNYLPAITGYVLDDAETTRRFLYDYRNFLSDLVIENHYAKAKEICDRYGIGFTAEAAGPGPPTHLDVPMESIRSSGVLSFPRGEFWVSDDGPSRDHLQIIKGIASAAHLYNQPYVTAEAFTGVYLWYYGPGDLKPYADRAFAEGLNRIDFHTFPHTPTHTGLPGWNYGFANLISENLIWWPKAKGFLQYLGRSSYLLQQGNFIADALYYHGDEAPFFAKPKHIKSGLGIGYDYDVTNTEILLNHLQVKNRKLILPHGQSYEVLVLPEKNWISLKVLQKIEAIVRKGATVIGPKPLKSNGLHNRILNDKTVKDLADRLWGNLNGENILERNYGEGKLIWGKQPREVLKEKGIGPDFSIETENDRDTLDFIHRLDNNTDIYYIRNPSNKDVHAIIDFRVSKKQPELWDPLTGKVKPLSLYFSKIKNTKVPLILPPYGSVFIIFRSASRQNIRVMKNDVMVFPVDRITHPWPFEDLGSANIKFLEGGNYLFLRGNKKQSYSVESPLQIPLRGPWNLIFTDPWNEVFSTEISHLRSWTDFEAHKFKYFSGMVKYEKTFHVDSSLIEDNKHMILNLGIVEEAAEVFINGVSVELVWNNPAKVNVTKHIQEGKNQLSVEVVNRWPNRMIGDYKLKESERKVRSNITSLPNAWHAPLEQLPDDTYSLQKSGLLGPVILEIYPSYDLNN